MALKQLYSINVVNVLLKRGLQSFYIYISLLCAGIHVGFVAEALVFQIVCHRKLFYMLIYQDAYFLGYNSPLLFWMC